MKRTLHVAGTAALLVWTALGLFVWVRISLHEASSSEESARSQSASELTALADQVSALHADLRSLADALAQNLQSLQDNLERGERERVAALERELTALRERMDATRPGVATEGGTASPAAAPSPNATAGAEPAASTSGSDAPAAPPPSEGKKSFLAFRLPSDDFKFDERRVWTVLPSLSRVGFDASSTLHDFSGATSHVAGELEVDPSHPSDAPRARIQVEAAKLDTGNADRDADMRIQLGTDAYPELLFELERFASATVDVPGMRVEGTASGTLTIHGVKRAVSMPVKLSVDDAHRLFVEGEMTLKLSDYGVSVPSKLGVITVKDEAKIWISLKLRASARR